MRIKTPHYYRNFKCIAGACSDSCCAGWEVDLDDESFAAYEAVEGPFGERLRSVMSTENEKHFVIQNLRCPFLNECNLCDIYTELGEEALCETCTNFPRCYEEFGSLKEMALSMACPEVVRLMLESDEHINFDIKEDGKPLTHYNDINGDMYMALNGARACIYHILKNDSYNVVQKLLLIISLGDELEVCMPKENYRKIEKLTAEYEQPDKLDKKLAKVTGDKADYGEYVKGVYELLAGCECVSDKWRGMLANVGDNMELMSQKRQEFNDVTAEYKREYEYFLENLTYRYVLRSVFDGRIADKTRFLAFMYLVLKELSLGWWIAKGQLSLEDRMLIMQTLSKELEHSDENMALLWELCHKNEGLQASKCLVGILLEEMV